MNLLFLTVSDYKLKKLVKKTSFDIKDAESRSLVHNKGV
jgi:hypothetical protein